MPTGFSAEPPPRGEYGTNKTVKVRTVKVTNKTVKVTDKTAQVSRMLKVLG